MCSGGGVCVCFGCFVICLYAKVFILRNTRDMTGTFFVVKPLVLITGFKRHCCSDVTTYPSLKEKENKQLLGIK